MLILGRRQGESIVIDGGIRLVVLAVDRKGVRLGIEAPPSVTILRGEIVTEVADENRRATTGPGAAAWLDALPVRPSIGETAEGS
jgi:carbon storage regulator